MPKLFNSRVLCSYVAILVICAFMLQSIFIPQNVYASKNNVSENCLATKSFIQTLNGDIYTNMFLGSACNLIKENIINNDSADFNMSSLNTDKFFVNDIKADDKKVTIVFEEQETLKEISYIFAKDDFLKSENVATLLESERSISVIKTKDANKTVSISKTQSKKTFLGSLVNRINKAVFLGILLFFVSIAPAYAQQVASSSSSAAHISYEQTFEQELNGLMYDFAEDLYMDQNKKYSEYPGFYNEQQEFAKKYVQNPAYTLAGLNYNVYATIYRPLTLVDGSKSTFYDEVIRVADEYNVSAYLLFMHAVTERMDLVAYEGAFDRLSSTASKGSFQMSPVSLLKYIEEIYQLDQAEREREYPFTKGYLTLSDFERSFDANSVLALDNDDNYNPLEIELAATYLKRNFLAMQKLFPGIFPDNFLTHPLNLKESAQTADERNRMTLWSISYTANIYNFNTTDMWKIFDKQHDKDIGVYAWTRLSWRMFNYLENLDSSEGYEAFAYESFDSISEAETRQAQMKENNVEVIVYYAVMIFRQLAHMLMSWQGVVFMLAFGSSMFALYKKTKKWRQKMRAKRHAFEAKIKQKRSVKYINKVGLKLQDKFIDLADYVFEDKEERVKRKRQVATQNVSLQNQKVVKRPNSQRIKIKKDQMGVMYAALGENESSVFNLEQRSKNEGTYDFLLRISDNYMDAIVKRYPALGSDEFRANDILKGVTIRLRDMEGVEGVKKVQEIRNFMNNNNFYVPITSVIEFFETTEVFSKVSNPEYDNTVSRVKQAA